jgi:hypothetical protein
MEIKRVFDILELYNNEYAELKDAFSYKEKRFLGKFFGTRLL